MLLHWVVSHKSLNSHSQLFTRICSPFSTPFSVNSLWKLTNTQIKTKQRKKRAQKVFCIIFLCFCYVFERQLWDKFLNHILRVFSLFPLKQHCYEYIFHFVICRDASLWVTWFSTQRIYLQSWNGKKKKKEAQQPAGIKPTTAWFFNLRPTTVLRPLPTMMRTLHD